MISRDYTKEVGIPSQKKHLPRPLAFVVLALVAVGAYFAVTGVRTETRKHEAAGKTASSSAAAATSAPTEAPAQPSNTESTPAN